MQVDMSASAALIRLPEEQTAMSDDFGPQTLVLEDAVDRVTAEEPDHPDEKPWIKTDDGIIGLNEIAQLRVGLRTMRRFNASRP